MDLALNPKTPNQTIFEWLYNEIRLAILARQLQPGRRVPSTRDLANQYEISRGTVVGVYEQLCSEGYLTSRTGAGTSVSAELPDRGENGSQSEPSLVALLSKPRVKVSTASKFYMSAQLHGVVRESPKAFRPHQGAHDLFPRQIWGRIASRVLRRMSPWTLGSMDPRGYLPLRRAISERLLASRGVKCDADQIFIVSGLQQALDISLRALINVGDTVWLEDPGYRGAFNTFLAAGARVVSVPVDGKGLDFSRADLKKLPGMIYTTPAHQFPLGISMSLERRLDLLEFAAKRGSWIFEDDYDGEFRYRGRPLPSLQSIDKNGIVLYVSSFSKTLFTGIRLGYLIVPRRNVDLFCAVRSVVDRFSATLEQAVLAEFINDGHYGHHLRRMRRIYGERHHALETQIRKYFDGAVSLESSDAGLQSVAWLPAKFDDKEVATSGAEQGLELLPVSAFSRRIKTPPGLILGFAAVSEKQIHEGVESLAKLLL